MHSMWMSSINISWMSMVAYSQFLRIKLTPSLAYLIRRLIHTPIHPSIHLSSIHQSIHPSIDTIASLNSLYSCEPFGFNFSFFSNNFSIGQFPMTIIFQTNIHNPVTFNCDQVCLKCDCDKTFFEFCDDDDDDDGDNDGEIFLRWPLTMY